jgi:hypothetical protein
MAGMEGVLAIVYAIWCGVCWRLRGGKYGDYHRQLFGREPGTQLTRAACATLMTIPLAFVDPAYAVLVLSIWAAMTLGYFDDSMGLEEEPRDYVFLSLWGLAVATVMVTPVAALKSSFSIYSWATLGALVVVGYHVNKRIGNDKRFDWTERAEMTTGVIFGLAIAGAVAW